MVWSVWWAGGCAGAHRCWAGGLCGKRVCWEGGALPYGQ